MVIASSITDSTVIVQLFLPRRYLLRCHLFIFSRCIIVTMTCTRPIRFILALLESSNLRVINAAACIVTLYCFLMKITIIINNHFRRNVEQDLILKSLSPIWTREE